MTLSGAEVFLTLLVVLIGIVGNIWYYFKQDKKSKQIEWNLNMYWAAFLILICGFFTPPDILSNLLFLVPLILISRLILKFVLRKKSSPI